MQGALMYRDTTDTSVTPLPMLISSICYVIRSKLSNIYWGKYANFLNTSVRPDFGTQHDVFPQALLLPDESPKLCCGATTGDGIF